jgi:hypothetical protein
MSHIQDESRELFQIPLLSKGLFQDTRCTMNELLTTCLLRCLAMATMPWPVGLPLSISISSEFLLSGELLSLVNLLSVVLFSSTTVASSVVIFLYTPYKTGARTIHLKFIASRKYFNSQAIVTQFC